MVKQFKSWFTIVRNLVKPYEERLRNSAAARLAITSPEGHKSVDVLARDALKCRLEASQPLADSTDKKEVADLIAAAVRVSNLRKQQREIALKQQLVNIPESKQNKQQQQQLKQSPNSRNSNKRNNYQRYNERAISEMNYMESTRANTSMNAKNKNNAPQAPQSFRRCYYVPVLNPLPDFKDRQVTVLSTQLYGLRDVDFLKPNIDNNRLPKSVYETAKMRQMELYQTSDMLGFFMKDANEHMRAQCKESISEEASPLTTEEAGRGRI